MDKSVSQFRIGNLYPVDKDGNPNIVLSSGYSLKQDNSGFYVIDNSSVGSLKATLEITTDPVSIANVSKYVEDWLIPQLTNKENESSIFNQYLKTITNPPNDKNNPGAWGAYANNQLLEALSYLGYRGYGFDQAANQTGIWAENSKPNSFLHQEVLKKENYDPSLVWSKDKGIDTIYSEFDSNSLLKNLASMNGSFEGKPYPL